MNWLQRARREIVDVPSRATAIAAERTPTAVMAVPAGALIQKSPAPDGELIGPDPQSLAENLREAFEERAAILEFDGELDRDQAEAVAWAAIVEHRRIH